MVGSILSYMKNLLLTGLGVIALLMIGIWLDFITVNQSVKDQLSELLDESALELLKDLPQSFNSDDQDKSLSGKIIRIVDGDTVEFRESANMVYTIRLTEIDTPERDQPWGSRSTRALSKKVSRKVVSVRTQGTDRYGRVLGRILLGDRDINRELVSEGHAWAYRQYLTDQSFLQNEEAARNKKLGLWSQSDPIAPWEWRRGVRHTSQSAKQTLDDFTCGTKRYCREMRSCEEALFYLRQCGLNRLDGDSDGTPCESLCR